MSWRHHIEIDLRALRTNIATVQKLAGHRELIAMIKANAYGLGIERCAPIYAEMGVNILAVAALSEVQRIRTVAPQQRILLLGPLLPHELQEFMDAPVEICISSAQELNVLTACAQQYNTALAVHLDIDTGMGRNGCLPQDASALIEHINDSEQLELAGICAHYPSAQNQGFSSVQDSIFESIIASCDQKLPINCLIHRANSEGLLLRDQGSCNAVRVGLLHTGVNLTTNINTELQEVLRWSTQIALCKKLPEQHSISYNRTHRLQKDSHIAVIPVGYADGIPIALSNCGRVLIHQQQCPILGRVTMDYIMVDISKLGDHGNNVSTGDEVVLIGQQGDAYQSISDFSQQAQTIPYDILCGLRHHRAKITYNE